MTTSIGLPKEMRHGGSAISLRHTLPLTQSDLERFLSSIGYTLFINSPAPTLRVGYKLYGYTWRYGFMYVVIVLIAMLRGVSMVYLGDN